MWSDSQVCLNWLVKRSPHNEIFICNRVYEIKSLAEKLEIKFLYIISQENPEDILTKYKSSDLESILWKKGPGILNEPSRW